MDPATQQHLFFAPPEWPPSQSRKPKQALARKRRRSVSGREDGPPSPRDDSPSSSSHEATHLDPKSRRGGHTKRYNAILTTHSLPPQPPLPHSLRKIHSTAMVALLHRSLLERDYPRASRAYGLLLRCTDVDIRTVWSIGLEILLRRPHTPNVPRALEFLNRLVLEYPYNHVLHAYHPAFGRTGGKRSVPRPSVVEFYPALFNLLVKASSRAAVVDNKEEGEEEEEEEEGSVELQPERIRERIAALTMTPPWANMAALWLLRGMVCHWIADLKGKNRELRIEAAMCFAKVREMGGEVPEGVERGDRESDVEGDRESDVEDDMTDFGQVASGGRGVEGDEESDMAEDDMGEDDMTDFTQEAARHKGNGESYAEGDEESDMGEDDMTDFTQEAARHKGNGESDMENGNTTDFSQESTHHKGNEESDMEKSDTTSSSQETVRHKGNRDSYAEGNRDSDMTDSASDGDYAS